MDRVPRLNRCQSYGVAMAVGPRNQEFCFLRCESGLSIEFDFYAPSIEDASCLRSPTGVVDRHDPDRSVTLRAMNEDGSRPGFVAEMNGRCRMHCFPGHPIPNSHNEMVSAGNDTEEGSHRLTPFSQPKSA